MYNTCLFVFKDLYSTASNIITLKSVSNGSVYRCPKQQLHILLTHSHTQFSLSYPSPFDLNRERGEEKHILHFDFEPQYVMLWRHPVQSF